MLTSKIDWKEIRKNTASDINACVVAKSLVKCMINDEQKIVFLLIKKLINTKMTGIFLLVKRL